MRVLFAGGVTGGHIAPGVALAEKVVGARDGSEVMFASVANAVEEQMIARRGLRLVRVCARTAGVAQTVVKAPGALLRARRLVRSFKPDVVVGLGGAASLWPCLAARLAGTPIVLLEQNTIPGRTTRQLARWAAVVCCQWESTVGRLGRRARFTGSPVRSEVIAARAQDKAAARKSLGLAPELPVVLVMGGSQGAEALNAALAGAASALAGRAQLVHLFGDHDGSALTAVYRAAGLAAHVTPFLDPMDLAYAAADVAFSRAGATSIAELAAAGVPAVLVPYPFATDDHQRVNAQEAAEQGWAVVLEQSKLDAAQAGTAIHAILAFKTRLEAMRRKALAAARPDAADVIQEVLRAASRAHAARAPHGESVAAGT